MKAAWGVGMAGDKVSLTVFDGEDYTTLLLSKDSAKTLLKVLAALVEEPKEIK